MGGILGVLMMIPLRRSLIVKEHEELKYPEGAACASVLIAGEKGGDFAKTAFQGVGIAVVYAILQKVFHVIAETPAWVTARTNKWLPNATVNGEITPEYMGVGYIIGPKIAGVLVAGGVLAWLGLIPLLGFLVPGDVGLRPARQGGQQPGRLRLGPGHPHLRQHRQRHLPRLRPPDRRRRGGGRRLHHAAQDPAHHLHLAARLHPLPLRQDRRRTSIKRTDRDLSFVTVIAGSLGLVVVLVALPFIPGNTILNKILVAVLVIVFGFIFVTVSSRIVGLIGSSSNPISGMTIATLMATAMVFVGLGWTGSAYEPMALVVGGMVCIAAANAGATSQDLKTGYLIGATPRAQQIVALRGRHRLGGGHRPHREGARHPERRPARQGHHPRHRHREVPGPAGHAHGDPHQGAALAQPRLGLRAGGRLLLHHHGAVRREGRSPSRSASTCRSPPPCPSSRAAW